MAKELNWSKEQQEVLNEPFLNAITIAIVEFDVKERNVYIESQEHIPLLFQNELAHATRFLRLEMGLNLKDESKNEVPINFSKEDINLYIQRFRSLDIDNKGYITVNDLRRYFKVTIAAYIMSDDQPELQLLHL